METEKKKSMEALLIALENYIGEINTEISNIINAAARNITDDHEEERAQLKYYSDELIKFYDFSHEYGAKADDAKQIINITIKLYEVNYTN